MWDQWNDVFRDVLGPAERSLVSELRGIRNHWAHNEQFSSNDAIRALDSMERLLNAVSAAEAAAEVGQMRMDLMRIVFRRTTPLGDAQEIVPADRRQAPGRPEAVA